MLVGNKLKLTYSNYNMIKNDIEIQKGRNYYISLAIKKINQKYCLRMLFYYGKKKNDYLEVKHELRLRKNIDKNTKGGRFYTYIGKIKTKYLSTLIYYYMNVGK